MTWAVQKCWVLCQNYGNPIFRAVEPSILYEIINIQLIICSFQVPGDRNSLKKVPGNIFALSIATSLLVSQDLEHTTPFYSRQLCNNIYSHVSQQPNHLHSSLHNHIIIWTKAERKSLLIHIIFSFFYLPHWCCNHLKIILTYTKEFQEPGIENHIGSQYFFPYNLFFSLDVL